MFSGYELKISKQFFGNKFNEYKVRGEKHLDTQKAEFKEEITDYILDEEIDGSKISNDWFPTMNADIFLSHSHEDKALACALAGWLNEKFGLRCFIDSNVWGWSDKILEKLNDKYSHKKEISNGGFLYDYKCGCRVSQHVNVMLSVALLKMIDNVESVIFLNTDHSVSVFDEDQISSTYSPWIYTEIICTKYVQKKPLIVYRNYLTLKHNYYFEQIFSENIQQKNDIKISYMLPLTHLKKLDEQLLKIWENEYNQSIKTEYAMDILYKKFYPKELKLTHYIIERCSDNEIKRIKNFYNGSQKDETEIWSLIENKIYG